MKINSRERYWVKLDVYKRPIGVVTIRNDKPKSSGIWVDITDCINVCCEPDAPTVPDVTLAFSTATGTTLLFEDATSPGGYPLSIVPPLTGTTAGGDFTYVVSGQSITFTPVDEGSNASDTVILIATDGFNYVPFTVTVSYTAATTTTTTTTTTGG